MKIRNRFGLLLAFIMTIVSIPVGFSAWSTISPISSSKVITIPTSDKQVAYYDSNYFPTIESAVASANAVGNKTVYVIPGTNPTINEPITINSGVTLVFPFDEKYYHADSTSSSDKYVQANRTPSETVANRITIKDNISSDSTPAITVNGNLYIGAINSYSHNTYLLNPLGGSVCVLDMGANNRMVVNNGGFIQCFGKIVNTNDTSLITVNSGGVIENQIQVYDWPGGTKATTDFYPVFAATAYIFPFSKFDLPQINTPMVYNAGGLMKGCIRAEVGNQYFLERNGLTIIGKDGSSFINLGSNGVCYFNFDCVTGENIGNGLTNHSTYFELRSGNVSFGTLSLTVKMFLTVTISTSKASMPLPSGFTVKICSGVTCAYNISMYFAKDSKVIIDEGANVTINCSSSGASYKGIVFLPGSEFINNSNKLSIAGPVGGLVTTEKAGAELSTGDISAVSGENKYVYAESLTSTNPTSATILKNIPGYLNNLQGNVLSPNSVTQPNLLTANRSYESVQDGSIFYWSGNLVEANEIELTLSSYESESGEAYNGTATVKIGPWDAYDFYHYDTFVWSVSGGGVYLGTTADNAQNNEATSLTLTGTGTSAKEIYFFAEANMNEGSKRDDFAPIPATITVTAKKSENDEGVLSNAATFTRVGIEGSGGGCLVEGTLVTMSDGTKLPVEQLKEGDVVKVFDHSTGKLTTSIVARDTHNDEQAIQIDVMNLKFSDGTISRTAVDHGYFSREENKYVYIDANNYEEYLGKEFVIFDDNGGIDYVTLDEVKITNENVRIFAPITYKHLNLIADDLLTISGGLEGIFNYFDLDENMMIDRDKMNEDIERYGLYTYEEWAEYLTPVQFDVFNVKYLKVSVGKGLVTKERLIEYIKMYLY